MKARLELISLDIEKARERWNLYMIIETEHPSEPDKTIIIIIPNESTIPLRKKSDNYYSFVAKGEGSDGLFILERDIPVKGTIKVRVYLMHSRELFRKAGNKLSELNKIIDSDNNLITTIKTIGSSTLQGIILKKGLSSLGNILENINDRNLGFISMDESFGKEFKERD